jgi:6-phosphogluconolactonase
MKRARLIVAPAEKWAAVAAAHIAASVSSALGGPTGSRCHVALAGGQTPKPVYAELGAAYATPIDWSRVELFLSDERLVPLDHQDSNYLAVKTTLLEPLADRAPRLHAVATNWDPAHAALAYELTIRQTVPADANDPPPFDLILLGAGKDGHTASLFPASSLLSEWTRLVAATVHPQTQRARVTFTPALLSAAAEIVFLVSGSDKAGMLAQVYNADPTPALPATVVAAAAVNCTWIVDEPAAAQLTVR